MRIRTKHVLPLFLLALMLFTLAVTASATTYKQGDIITYGSYPQSEVTDSALIAKLDAQEGSWVSYNYYIEGEVSDFMQYKDVTLDGAKYRAVKFSSYRPYRTTNLSSSARNSYQGDNGYNINTVYWFKYEPVKWRVLDATDGENLLVFSESILDSQAFRNTYYSSNYKHYTDSTKTYYANNYPQSDIRAWLNGDFYNTTFSADEKSHIHTTTITNEAYPGYSQYDAASTQDKVFLLSYNEAIDADYGFIDDVTRIAKGSDYAKAQGLCALDVFGDYAENSWWWIRSAAYNSDCGYGVDYIGAIDDFDDRDIRVDCVFSGVRVAFRLNPASFNPSIKTGTCGDNLIWTLDIDAGVLAISGTGDMDSFVFDGAPWYADRSSIRTVTIADGVTSIGGNALQDCENLTSITIPDSVTSIGYMAFQYCSNLTSLTIGNGVECIMDYAFKGCSSLESVTIPNSVTNIGESAFYGCNLLNETLITDLAAWCKISFGNHYANPLFVAYEPNFYLNGKLVTDLVIPEGVTSIENYVFSGGRSFTSIIIPDGVKNIGISAFRHCISLTSIAIPDSVNYIMEDAFHDCRNLTSITIPNSVTNIGDFAFAYCSSLANITISESATRIESSTFKNCVGLTRITILSTNCEIWDSENTIPDTAVIYGYAGSTAEAYAKKYNRTFVVPAATTVTAKASAAVYADGTATLRVTAMPTLADGAEVERYGVFFAPAKYADSYATNGLIVVKEGALASGKTFAADLIGIPADAFDVPIYAWAFVKLVGVEDLVVCPVTSVCVRDLLK